MISRRAFLQSALLGGSALGAGLVSRDLDLNGPTGDFILEQVSVPIPDLPTAFNGYKIGFLTDLHLGVWVPDEWIIRGVEELTKHHIDLLILGGDYILVNEVNLWQECGVVRNARFAALTKVEAIPQIYSSVRRIFDGRSFPDGIFGVVGNHDHWNSFPIFQEIMRGHPTLNILINQEIEISRKEQRLLLFGVDDYLTGIPTLPPAKDLTPGRSARIIASHNPDYIAALLNYPNAQFDFAMCGHTHGGQIVLPFVGPIAAQVADRRFISGMKEIQPHSIYTSRGLGVVGLPCRINCPAEVTVFTLIRT